MQSRGADFNITREHQQAGMDQAQQQITVLARMRRTSATLDDILTSMQRPLQQPSGRENSFNTSYSGGKSGNSSVRHEVLPKGAARLQLAAGSTGTSALKPKGVNFIGDSDQLDDLERELAAASLSR
jgi:hypothetical protein